MEESVVSDSGDLQNIPPGVHSMATVLDPANDVEATQQPIAIDSLAVIVPVYNEDRTVAELLRRLEAQPCVSQIIIVDDGSTDGTWQELAHWRARASVQWEQNAAESQKRLAAGELSIIVLQHDRNCGKGRAIRTGLDQVTRSHVIIQDADLEYDPADISKLWQVMQSDQAKAVYGSRYLETPDLQRGRFVLQSGVRFLNLLVRLIYGVRLTDEATCYKMFRTSDLRQMRLQCERFEFCPEVTAKAGILRLRIIEVPVSYLPRSHAVGKKLRFRDAIPAVFTLLRVRLLSKKSVFVNGSTQGVWLASRQEMNGGLGKL